MRGLASLTGDGARRSILAVPPPSRQAILPALLIAAVVLAAPAGLAAAASDGETEDAYPLVSAPEAVSADEAGLADGTVVVGVLSGGEARAYPIRALWHEGLHTVNDLLGGAPVGVSMCPLAGVGVAYDRRVGHETLELGSLVEVDRGSLAFYDGASRSRWDLMTGQAVDGPRAGERLGRVSSLFTTWGRWRSLHPDTTVYEDPGGAGKDFVLDGARLRLMITTGSGPARPRDWVIGLPGRDGAVALLGRELAPRRTANLDFEGRPIVAFMTEDATTAVVWERTVEGRSLTFAAAGDRMVDAETGTSWEPLTGRAESGPLKDRQLTAVPYVTGFWHAWLGHFPDSVVLDLRAD